MTSEGANMLATSSFMTKSHISFHLELFSRLTNQNNELKDTKTAVESAHFYLIHRWCETTELLGSFHGNITRYAKIQLRWSSSPLDGKQRKSFMED